MTSLSRWIPRGNPESSCSFCSFCTALRYLLDQMCHLFSIDQKGQQIPTTFTSGCKSRPFGIRNVVPSISNTSPVQQSNVECEMCILEAVRVRACMCMYEAKFQEGPYNPNRSTPNWWGQIHHTNSWVQHMAQAVLAPAVELLVCNNLHAERVGNEQPVGQWLSCLSSSQRFRPPTCHSDFEEQSWSNRL